MQITETAPSKSHAIVARILAALKAKREMSTSELGDALNVHNSYISRECGRLLRRGILLKRRALDVDDKSTTWTLWRLAR